MNDIIKPCSKCGKDWGYAELIDIIYPSKRDPYTGQFTEWNVICQVHNTGCGRTVYGKNQKEAADRWNAGETDEIV